METPTARIMKENTYRVGASQVHPYRTYYAALGALARLEVDGRITEFIGVPGFPTSGGSSYGNDKDKAFDAKHQFLPETRYLPAFAVGIMDPSGTRKFGSQYLVASKQIWPFDFTLGFGNGRFGKHPLAEASEGFKMELFSDPKQWLNDGQFFFGIQFAPSPKYALMMEYNPIRYDKQTSDSAQSKYFQDPVQSHWNFGLRWKPFTWAELDLTYQRGEQFGLNASVNFDIGNPLIPIYNKPYKEKPADRYIPLNERVAKALVSLGFSNIGVVVKDDELWIRGENERYFYNMKATGMILTTLDEIVPPTINKYRIMLTANGLPLWEFEALRQDALDLHADKLTVDEFYRLSTVKTDVTEPFDAPISNKKLYSFGWKPSLLTFLNDPSGYFKCAVGAEGWTSLYPWKGGTFVGSLAAYPFNNISTVNEPSSIPVRSDIVPYLEQNISLNRLMFEQMGRATDNIYWRGSLGYLEIEYAGLDGEVAKPLLDGLIWVGLSGSWVKKRAVDSPLGFKNNNVKDSYYTGFANGRLNIPGLDMAFDVKAGRFLAGDKGVRLTLSKNIKGVSVYAWYSFTDTSVFSDSYNRGYNDKGIGVTIPMRLFEGTDSRTVINYAIVPWTRDVAQDIFHFNTLPDYFGGTTKSELDKSRKMLQ
jgi:hypothetical protein